MALNFARQGEKLKGVVSFHGSLLGVPLDQNVLKADVLVCHGEDDKFVKPEEVAEFKKEMDEIGASYTFKSYAGATHAFSNPNATEKGKKFNLPIAYNETADTASFSEMKSFFNKIFK
jgi:dienelactone hydrolase